MALFVLRAFVTLCLVSYVSSCSCGHRTYDLQDIYCHANYVIEFRVTRIAERRGRYSDRRFIITTPVVYKSSTAYIDVEDKNSLYTGADGGVCGISLRQGTTYIISGYISRDGKLRVGLCSPLYKRRDEFTADELRDLKSGYPSGC